MFEEDKVKVEVDVLGGFPSRPQLETPVPHRAQEVTVCESRGGRLGRLPVPSRVSVDVKQH